MQDNVFSIKLIKKNGKLTHQKGGELALYNEFVNGIQEGQVVEAFFEAQKDNGTAPRS